MITRRGLLKGLLSAPVMGVVLKAETLVASVLPAPSGTVFRVPEDFRTLRSAVAAMHTIQSDAPITIILSGGKHWCGRLVMKHLKMPTLNILGSECTKIMGCIDVTNSHVSLRDLELVQLTHETAVTVRLGSSAHIDSVDATGRFNPPTDDEMENINMLPGSRLWYDGDTIRSGAPVAVVATDIKSGDQE